MAGTRRLTIRGLRPLGTNIVALPRETMAAANMVRTISGKAESLVKASDPQTVEAVLNDAFAEQIADLAIKRDPHVSYWGLLRWLLDDGGATSPSNADFFDAAASPLAGNATPGRWNNLLDNRQPLKPSLIHNIGIFVVLRAPAPFIPELMAVMSANLKLKRNKEVIFEAPLSQALTGLITIDSGATPKESRYDIVSNVAGGLELEGHGAPFLMNEALGLEIEWTVHSTFNTGTADTDEVLIIGRCDGEAMET